MGILVICTVRDEHIQLRIIHPYSSISIPIHLNGNCLTAQVRGLTQSLSLSTIPTYLLRLMNMVVVFS